MRPLVQFQRPVDTESGPGIAAFTVVRRRARRDGGRPHPDSRASHRGHGLAAALADASATARWGFVDLVVVSRRRRGGGGPLRALHRSRGASPTAVRPGDRARPRSGAVDVAGCVRGDVPRRLPSRGCRSWAPMRSGCNRSPRWKPDSKREAWRCAGSARRWSCRFRRNLALGAWLFVENAARSALAKPSSPLWNRAGSVR